MVASEMPECNGAVDRNDISDLIGGNGRWQFWIFVANFVANVPLASLNMAMTFFAPNQEFWCARPPDAANLSVEEWKRLGLPSGDTKCMRYPYYNASLLHGQIETPTREAVPCDSWEYGMSEYGSTLTVKFDLVCGREWFVSMSTSIYVAGFMLSTAVSGYLADRFGRKPVMVYSYLLCVAACVVCAFSPSYAMFAACRFFVAAGISGAVTTNMVFLMEVCDSKQRAIYGSVLNLGWVLGWICLPALTYALKDWFWVQILITMPLVLLLCTWRIQPESPRWLLAKGKLGEARKTVMAAASMNGVHTPDLDERLKDIVRRTSKKQEIGNKEGTILSLLTTRGMRYKTLIVFFTFFAIAFVYYGISYHTNELAGDPFLNFAVSGLVEIPAYVITMWAIQIMGRKIPLIASQVLVGVACLVMYFLPIDPPWLSTTVSMLGKFSITCSFTIVYILAAEVFPTVLRNQGVGGASVCGRFGNILAPFVKELGAATHPFVPQLVFGALGATSGVLVSFLPETRDAEVPDTLEEATRR